MLPNLRGAGPKLNEIRRNLSSWKFLRPFSEAHSESSQMYDMEFFAKIVNNWKPITDFS